MRKTQYIDEITKKKNINKPTIEIQEFYETKRDKKKNKTTKTTLHFDSIVFRIEWFVCLFVLR